MGDKKRKLVQNSAEETVAVEPEGKKAKREDKKKEKRKAKEVVDEIEGGSQAEETPKEKKDKKEKKEKKDKKEKKEMKDKKDKEEKKDKKDKKEKKEKKDKREDDEIETMNNTSKQESFDAMDVDEKPSKETEKPSPETEKGSKKDKKSKKEKKYKTSAIENKEQQQEAGQSQRTEDEPTGKQKPNRFIVFVGNLPYSANAESLKTHFEKNPPVSVRVATEKDKPTKCRGFGFVEFEHYDRMKTCLKLYHHSIFDDGKYPPRRINVELTAGGGGKSDHRKSKIEAKNKKLAEERQNAAQKEKERKVQVEENGADDYAGVHPSRRNRMA
ncbi:hypothetical protein EYZ11_002457 [Aspergillus tanneri]|nr:hypothetical protein EYZ11_002457 [Aspergillus tanneri]